jgi:hypothetical protein
MMPEPDAAALAAERETLNGRIDDLRAFEREYRARLRLYLEDQLAELDATGTAYQMRTATMRIAGASDGELRRALGELGESQRARLLAALLSVPVPEAAA